jgi:hypothetical protein
MGRDVLFSFHRILRPFGLAAPSPSTLRQHTVRTGSSIGRGPALLLDPLLICLEVQQYPLCLVCKRPFYDGLKQSAIRIEQSDGGFSPTFSSFCRFPGALQYRVAKCPLSCKPGGDNFAGSGAPTTVPTATNSFFCGSEDPPLKEGCRLVIQRVSS